MRKWMTAALCAVLAALLCVPVWSAQKAEIVPYYTPSTQEDARCIPLTLQQEHWHQGELQDTYWHTLYNPETASMMVELADASTSLSMVGDVTLGDWENAMAEYGYEQLYSTYNNVAYNAQELHLGWRWLGEMQQPIWFPAVNAIIGIQEVVYNGQTRYAVGVVFRGTNPLDLQDWMTDFTAYSDLEGFHEGFSQNAAYFYETLSHEIIFHVNNNYYSLYDIYDEMQEPNSKFCMLVMGHSLGGALTDLLVGRYLYEHGVHPSNLAGYTIGAALSAPSSFVDEYPYHNIINIISADDLVPAVTVMGHKHIGVNLTYYPDDDFRRVHYDREYVDRHPGESNLYWRSFGFIDTIAKPHLIDASYRSIVSSVSAEIAASTDEEHSKYTSYSTCGYNDWGFADAIVSPYTFGDFTGSIHTGGALRFRGGVLQIQDDFYTTGGLVMQQEEDYLLVEKDLTVSWGVAGDFSDHLTAGTVEVRGDFSADDGWYEYAYRETGTHRTVFSGTALQTVSMYDEDSQFYNLCIRNPHIDFDWAVPGIRLAEDAIITSTEALRVSTLDLNGHQLGQAGTLSVQTLTMGGGNLQVGGDTQIHTIQPLDGQMVVAGNFNTTETLPFHNGQMWVEGNCYLPATMIMQHEDDYLSVGKKLTLFARDWDEIPDDHLSAGTVELKGDLEFDDCGTCTENGYRETGSHKTILSGTGPQTIWFNRANAPNRFENLCIRNPQTSLYMVKDLRLGEDAAITVTGDNPAQRVKIDGTLDMAGYTLLVDATGWSNEDYWGVDIYGINTSAGGSLQVDGDMHFSGGKPASETEAVINPLTGQVTVTGSLTAADTLVFDDAQLQVGGDCTIGAGLIMQKEADYLLVGGDLTVKTNKYLSVPQDHLCAGTVELKGDLNVPGTGDHRAYQATGTHRTIFSGADTQTVQMGAMLDHKVLQACLRNPNVVLHSVHTLRLMEDGSIADASNCNIYGTLDLNGHSLAALGQFKLLKNGITDSSADKTGSASGGLVGLALAADTCTVSIARPTIPEVTEDADAFETVHILFTGYDSERMVVCETMSFTSQSQMSATLSLKNWPTCDRIQVFLLEGAYAPFCPEMRVPTATASET